MKSSKTILLPSTVSSALELDTMRLELREYAKWFSHNDIKKRVGVHKSTPEPMLSPASKDMLDSWKAVHPLSQKSLDELLEALHKIRQDAPSVTITLAAPATGELRRSLVAWCRSNIAADVLVDFRFNSTLLGGMVVRHGSHIFDWSFRRSIMENLGKFPEVLRNA